MSRANFATVLVVALALLQACQGSFFVAFMDALMGYSPNKMDVMHAFHGIQSMPESQCRLALAVKDRSGVSLLLNALSPLEELVTESEEFLRLLNAEEQVEMLEIYIKNLYPGKIRAIGGKALDVIMTILCREEAFELIKMALQKKIICERGVLLYFLKHHKEFIATVRAGILDHLDITASIIAGKGVLHVLAESGEKFVYLDLLQHLNFSAEEKIKFEHFTSIEGNSILHSAVLSNDPLIIETTVRHFNRLCGHLNKFGQSPLKLALISGNNFESIRALLDHGCVADGEIIFNDGEAQEEVEEMSKNLLRNLNLSLEMFSKWSPKTVVTFKNILSDAIKLMTVNPTVSRYYAMGVLNSFRSLSWSLDRMLSADLIGSPSLSSRSRASSLLSVRTRSQSPETGEVIMKKSPSLWSLLASEDFDGSSLENIPLAQVIEGMNFSFSSTEVKGRVLRNLTKVDKLDYSGGTLTRLIQVIIKYAEPSVLAYFVGRDIDYYFCVRSMFDQFSKNYEKLIPFLAAIGFDANDPFVDGIYPVHLAVKNNDLQLLHFLQIVYKANLRNKTVYEGNNVLHYGLGERISRDMMTYLLESAPELLSTPNDFEITPLQLSLSRTENYEIVSKVLDISQKAKGEYVFDYSPEVNEIFEEIMSNWPRNPATESNSKDKFYIMFQTCGSDEVARLLLSFVSKKLLKHLVNEKRTLANIETYEMKSPKSVYDSSSDSPNHICALNLSP